MVKYRYDETMSAATCGIYGDDGRLKMFTASMRDALVEADKHKQRLTVRTSAGLIDLSGLLK